MDYIKRAIYGPDPKEQHRKIKAILRKNARGIDRSLNELTSLQNKTKQLIKKAAKKNDIKSVRAYATELYRINKQYERMYTSKAQLQSIGMRIEEAYKVQMLTKQMAESTGLMREVNALVRLPQLRSSMMELEKELMRSGMISEMVDETLESVNEVDEQEDEAITEEVDKIVEQYANEKFSKVGNVPTEELPRPVTTEEEEEKMVPEDQISEEADRMLNDMREKLRALQD